MAKKKKGLSDATRNAIKEVVAQQMMDSAFGDGLERDYIMDGWSWPGLNNMSDEELIQELEMGGGCEDEEGEDYELLQTARKEMKGGK
jgi:hypothetical protein